MTEASKLGAALAMTNKGYAVFPLVPNGKTPAISNWQNLATTDPEQIRAWWSAQPQANIGHPTVNEITIDIDPRHGGHETFGNLVLTQSVTDPLPQTSIVETQSGGNHYYYALPPHTVVKGGTNKLGPGVDIKSWGGYVVAPGSTIDGRPYRWLNDRPISLAPQWLIDRCNAHKPRTEAAGERLVDEDDTAIELAQKWLDTHAPDAQLGTIDDTAYKVAARLYDFGVSKQTATEMLTEWSELHAFPPMQPDRIATVAESAGRNRDNAIGARHPGASGFEPIDIASKAPSEKPRGLFYLTLADGAAKALTHNAEPLIEGLIDCGTMSVVYGESNSGKSFQEMDKDYHVAAGVPWAGRPVKQGAVVWVAAEGGAGVYKRLAALKEHYKRDDVPFFIVPCPINLLRADADCGPLVELVRQIETAHACKVVKITLDTLSRVIAGGDENSSVDMGKLVHHFDAIRSATSAHLAVIHHTGKDKAKGARGHSLLRAATDTEIEIDAQTITVTKQRDLDGKVEVRFRLMPVRVGVDVRGKEVTSCWVDTSAEAAASFDIQPSRTEAEVLTALSWGLHNTTNKTFDWQFVSENWCKKASGKNPARQTVESHLTALTEKCWIKKLAPNQYVRTCRKLTEIDGFTQVMMTDFLGTLKSREIRHDHEQRIQSLAEQEGFAGVGVRNEAEPSEGEGRRAAGALVA